MSFIVAKKRPFSLATSDPSKVRHDVRNNLTSFAKPINFYFAAPL